MHLQEEVLAVSVDLSLIDCAFIRLCGQRYHGKIHTEENSARKFKAYYGKDYRIAREGLEVGDFIYYNNDKLRVVSVKCFESEATPTLIIPKTSLKERLKGASKVR